MSCTCPNCGIELHVVRTGGAEPKPVDAPVNPFGVDNYGRPFQSKEEADDYAARIAQWEANRTGQDAAQQAELQPGQVDIRNMPAEPDLGFIMSLLRDPVKAPQAFRTYGPTKYMHALSAFAQASGIRDRGDGFVVAPDLLPQLGSLTVGRAKQLAGF